MIAPAVRGPFAQQRVLRLPRRFKMAESVPTFYGYLAPLCPIVSTVTILPKEVSFRAATKRDTPLIRAELSNLTEHDTERPHAILRDLRSAENKLRFVALMHYWLGEDGEHLGD
jgi:hypothetical protein